MTDARTIAMLIALSAATFAVTSSGSAAAPFLQTIAHDLSTDLPTVAHLFALQSISWGSASLIMGALSDRLGRRAFLVGGIVLIGATRLGFAASPTYSAAAVWQLISGVGGGAFMSTVFAAVADQMPAGSRGRALSWIITGQSLSLVLGVPLITLLGTLGGWRGALAVHGTLTLMVAIAARLATPPDPARHLDVQHRRAPLARLAQPRLICVLGAGTTERACFASLAIYLPAYLQHTYGIGLAMLALALALVAVGNLIGNLFGGRIADRARSRPLVVATTCSLTAVFALPTLLWHPGLAASVALGFGFSFVNAAGRPSLVALLSEVPSELRGTLFGLSVTMNSMGWLLAGSVGAILLGSGGFGALGAFCTLLALLGAALAYASRAARPATHGA
ncbi:MAG TPA: MFS transporter [Burkholderiales bacterium]|nr:MFS transporter [Burkholderiales bacterium]